jgi:hypothetical protein
MRLGPGRRRRIPAPVRRLLGQLAASRGHPRGCLGPVEANPEGGKLLADQVERQRPSERPDLL